MFGKTAPDEEAPESDQMKWLSRGLFEALTTFIGRASGPSYKLRAMLYEFRYLPIAKAFGDARKAHADVAIRYEADEYKAKNEKVIKAAGIKSICKPQKSRSGIRHNKFIVLVHNNRPVAVWTGSTNISAGGIFGHSNVGHAVWDEEVAQRYLDYWSRLDADDVTGSALREANVALEATPASVTGLPETRPLTLFSPRDKSTETTTIDWYAELMSSAKNILCMTFAFNLDATLGKALEKKGGALKYAVFDKNLSAAVEDRIESAGNTVIAAGAKLGPKDLELFLGEELTGFNKNNYIHDKFLLVDPLGADPIVVTGSANFSNASQRTNDENMLVIRGNKRVADIYFGEFSRVFDHLYSRYIVAKMKKEGTSDARAGFLREATAKWLPQHFKPGRKQERRLRFMTE